MRLKSVFSRFCFRSVSTLLSQPSWRFLNITVHMLKGKIKREFFLLIFILFGGTNENQVIASESFLQIYQCLALVPNFFLKEHNETGSRPKQTNKRLTMNIGGLEKHANSFPASVRHLLAQEYYDRTWFTSL